MTERDDRAVDRGVAHIGVAETGDASGISLSTYVGPRGSGAAAHVVITEGAGVPDGAASVAKDGVVRDDAGLGGAAGGPGNAGDRLHDETTRERMLIETTMTEDTTITGGAADDRATAGRMTAADDATAAQAAAARAASAAIAAAENGEGGGEHAEAAFAAAAVEAATPGLAVAPAPDEPDAGAGEAGSATGAPATGASATTAAPAEPRPGRMAPPYDSSTRESIRTAKRVVVKVGSSSLTGPDGRTDPRRIDVIAEALQKRMGAGSDIILVSSGAVASGMGPLGLATRPTDLATKQAAAAVGQVRLAAEWARSFGRYGRTTAQVLLTSADAGERSRARNAQRTIDRLRQLGAVPIVNENDTVATSEMRFGDNDRLAALVSHLAYCDALVLLSDVEGLYDRNPSEPGARFVPEVWSGNDLKGVVAGDGGKLGTGGMASKVSAARLASRAGVPVLLASAADIDRALGAADVGTAFAPKEERLSAWKAWALYAADSAGVLRIDDGAVRAVTERRKSLLPVGITSFEGEFHSGDIVDIVGPGGEVVGRGEVAYHYEELAQIVGRPTSELPDGLQRPVVHADYLSGYATRA